MAISALAKKLQIKPGMKVALINAPAGTERLRPLPDGAAIAEGSAAVRADGLLWLSYPKGSAKMKTDLNRDVLRRTVDERHGLDGVSLVAFDDTWAAMRFRSKGAGRTAR